MAGSKVDYIIRLLRDDSDLKKQLKSTEKDISNLSAHERAEVKATAQARMDALTATAKALKKNPGNAELVKEIGKEAEFIREVLDEMKALNPAEEWVKNGKVFAQTFTNMHKQLSTLTGDIQELKETIAGLGNSFGNLGFNIAPTIDVSDATKQAVKAIDGMGDVVATRVHGVSKEIQRAYNKANTMLTSLSTNKLASFDIKDQKSLQATLNALRKSYADSVDESNYAETAAQEQKALAEAAKYAKEYLDLVQWAEKATKDPKSTIAHFTSVDENEIERMKNVIDTQISYARQQIDRYNEEVQKIHELNLADRITKNLKNLNIKLDLEPKAEFTKKVNNYIDDINKKNLHKIQLVFDDPQNLNKSKKKKTDSEQDTESVINETGLAKFEKAIDKMQERTLDKTKTWRAEMLKQLKFSGNDFSFNFGNALMDDLQSYFREQGHELEIFINEDELKRRIEGVVKDAGGGVVLGGSGGTATLDPKSLYDVMSAVFNGKPMPSFDVDTGLDKVDQQMEDNTDTTVKYVAALSDTTIHIDKVIASLRNFAKLAGQSNASKGAINIDTWLKK